MIFFFIYNFFYHYNKVKFFSDLYHVFSLHDFYSFKELNLIDKEHNQLTNHRINLLLPDLLLLSLVSQLLGRFRSLGSAYLFLILKIAFLFLFFG